MADINRLEELRAAKAARDSQKKAEADARELACLELEEKFTKELGPRGTQFEIIDTPEGPIVVRLGEAVLFKRMRDKPGEANSEDLQNFVSPCVVHPDKAAFSAMIEKRFGVLMRCSAALITLYSGAAAARAGEF